MAYSSTRHSFLRGARPVRPYRHRPDAASAAFPDLAPAERGGTARSHLARVRQDLAAQFDEVRRNPDANNPLSRLTVYGLNAALLILAFPVGFALLLFNVLAGENLRLTVHVLALTGVAIAVTTSEAGARLLGLL